MSCAVLLKLLYAVYSDHMLALPAGRNGWKGTHALLPHVAEDGIPIGDGDSSDSEESEIDVCVVHESVAPPVDDEAAVDE